MSTQDQKTLVASFIEKTNEFMNIFDYLADNVTTIEDTALRSEVLTTLNKGEKIRSVIDSAKSKLESVQGFTNDVWNSVTSWFSNEKEANLSFIFPVIPALVGSAIAAASAAVTAWIVDAGKTADRVQAYQDFRDEGYSANEAVRLANQLVGQSAKDSIFGTLIKAGGILTALYFGSKLLKQKSNAN